MMMLILFLVSKLMNPNIFKQLISLTGFTSDLVPLESFKFTVIDPTGEQINSGNLFPVDGNFDTTISLNTVNPVYGDYVVTAEYSEHIASTMFTLIENIVEVEDSMLQML